jgi:xanthine dehydrogenase YagS FAD-binding subunit
MTSPSFRYLRSATVAGAIEQGARADTAFIAGGTDLLQLWKCGASAPSEIVDISRLPLESCAWDGRSLRIGATARMAAVAADPLVVQHAPLVADALLASASSQIRNMATIGGNLLQRTRCVYFRGADVPCNKRAPDSGCGALDGENRQAALFGASPACVATHPSDLAVALRALDATIEVRAGAGVRQVPVAELYRRPGQTPQRDTHLLPGELITCVVVPDASRFARHMTFVKVRDRASFEFAVLSLAAALRIEDNIIVEARLVAGSVAPMPWRFGASEEALVSKALSADVIAAAADLAIEGARPLSQNRFKLDLLRNMVVRALNTIGGVR